jgi:hypothetical protein
MMSSSSSSGSLGSAPFRCRLRLLLLLLLLLWKIRPKKDAASDRRTKDRQSSGGRLGLGVVDSGCLEFEEDGSAAAAADDDDDDLSSHTQDEAWPPFPSLLP